MIRKQDILDRAAEWQLRPDVVEKDFVLAWVLAALARHPEAGRTWVFKGGTCLKKCYLETYRFSEDLDFTLRADAVYDAGSLGEILRQIAREGSAISGIRFFAESVAVRARRDRQDRETFEARLAYRGPLAMPGNPRVRFDLTRHETIVQSPEGRPIHHPYPDELPEGTRVCCYPIEELIAEKTRALLERTRPRDLYDVVLAMGDRIGELDLPRIQATFREKCEAKQLIPPTRAAIEATVRESPELASEWANMLAHQLPALPPLSGMIERLGDSLLWMGEGPVPTTPPLPPASLGGEDPPPVTYRFSQYWGTGKPLEAIRFAGACRLLVELRYEGENRTVEPYSLRRTEKASLLLYGREIASGEIKAYAVESIEALRVTDRPFRPRHRVEFTASRPGGSPGPPTEGHRP